jgi:hypothetical protein
MRSLIALYLPIACLIFCIFLAGFLADASVAKTDVISWVSMFVGAALFPVIIPIALAERFLKAGLPKPARLLDVPRYSASSHS